jgi:hypothetical protein
MARSALGASDRSPADRQEQVRFLLFSQLNPFVGGQFHTRTRPFLIAHAAFLASQSGRRGADNPALRTRARRLWLSSPCTLQGIALSSGGDPVGIENEPVVKVLVSPVKVSVTVTVVPAGTSTVPVTGAVPTST